MLLAVGALALLPAACGGDDDEGESAGGTGGNTAREQAFLEGMIPHHESAIEMARMAQENGQRQEIKQLADEIVSAQDAEIAQIRGIYRRLYDEEIKPDPMAHSRLGLTAEESNMAMDEGDMTMLEDAREFDREFIDMMVPHHQGAIRMARAGLDATEDAEVMELAEGIIEAQSREIRQMNSWRKKWYGAASPAGGVPSEADQGGSGGADHSGMDM